MKNKLYSLGLIFLLVFGLVSYNNVDAAERVCKQQTHWYYFSLADHSEGSKIESAPITSDCSSTFSGETWPEDAEIESITTYKGFTKEDIAMWYDLYVVSRVPAFTDENGEIHHVHEYSYRNETENKDDTKNIDDYTRKLYDTLSETERAQLRNDYIAKIFNAQIVPTVANVTMEKRDNGIFGTINRTYGGMSLNGITPYDNGQEGTKPYLISAKTKVVLNYDCEEPEIVPEEPETPEEPEEPLVQEQNPNTGDLGLIASSVVLATASGSGIYAYRKRKNL